MLEEDTDDQTPLQKLLSLGMYGYEKTLKNKSACEHDIEHDIMQGNMFFASAKINFVNFTNFTQSYLQLHENYMISDLKSILKTISNFEDLSN